MFEMDISTSKEENIKADITQDDENLSIIERF